MNEQLVQRVKECPNLPSLPAIAMQVLELARRHDADMAQIARTISRDPALAGKILRTVNSSFYGRAQSVSTISQSLVILGLQSVKTLVLGFSLVTTLSKDKPHGFSHLLYWKRSIYAATAAKTLAARVERSRQEEAFLSALLMDIGMLVLDQVVGDRYGKICATTPHHCDLADIERDELKLSHADAGGILAEQWNLPPVLAVPLSNHHNPERVDDPELRKLTELIHLANHCADVFVEREPAAAIAEVRRIGHELYKLSPPDVDALLAEIGTRTREVASLFEINIGTAAEYDAILVKANEAMTAVAGIDAIDATGAGRSGVRRSEARGESQTASATGEAQRSDDLDRVTGLMSRARFDELVDREFDAARRDSRAMALMVLDVDRFDQIADRFGRCAPDAVLGHLSRLLRIASRAQDTGGRIGEAAVALLMRGVSRDSAVATAEKIRRAMAARPVALAGTASTKSGTGSGAAGAAMIPATASVGVAWYDPQIPFANVAQFVKAANLALTNARHCGGNCVRVLSLRSRSEVASSGAAICKST